MNSLHQLYKREYFPLVTSGELLCFSGCPVGYGDMLTSLLKQIFYDQFAGSSGANEQDIFLLQVVKLFIAFFNSSIAYRESSAAHSGFCSDQLPCFERLGKKALKDLSNCFVLLCQLIGFLNLRNDLVFSQNH